jgi:hypothetical protein
LYDEYLVFFVGISRHELLLKERTMRFKAAEDSDDVVETGFA